MKISAHYVGSRGQSYTTHKQSAPLDRGYEIDFEYFRPHVGREDAVLDFGCGNGGILRLIRKRAARADGLEVNPASAAIARESGAKIYSSLDELPTSPIYDVITCNHVLEHVRDVCGTLERLRQCLKPGGCLVLKLPIDDARSSYQRQWAREDLDHHLQTWTPRLFANVLFESGFDVQECCVITSAWHSRLFPFMKVGLGPFLFWLLAVLKRRRQLFAVAKNPA